LIIILGAFSGAQISYTCRQVNNYFINVVILIFCWAIIEEVLFRGIIFQALLERFNPYLVIAVSGILFSVTHLFNQNVNLMSLINVFLAGVFLGTMYYTTKSLLFPIYYHFLWNLGTQLLFSSPVSGFDFEIGMIRVDFVSVKSGFLWLFSGSFGIEEGFITTISFVIFIILSPVLINPNPFIVSKLFIRRFNESRLTSEKYSTVKL